MTIDEFLADRLDEDEQITRAATGLLGRPWQTRLPQYDPEGYSGDVEIREGGTVVARAESPCGDHIARHDPTRVLREVATKRAILAAYSEHANLDTGEDPEPEYADGHARGLGLAVRHMAAVHADHPDYDPDWAPAT